MKVAGQVSVRVTEWYEDFSKLDKNEDKDSQAAEEAFSRLESDFRFRFVRRSLTLFGFLSRIDMIGGRKNPFLEEQFDERIYRGSNILRKSYSFLVSRFSQFFRLSVWEIETRHSYVSLGQSRYLYYLPEFILVCGLFSCFHLKFIMFLKYSHDFALLELESLESEFKLNPNKDLERSINRLSSHLKSVSERLDLYGNPHSHLSFAPEWSYSMQLLNYLLVLAMMMYLRLFDPSYNPCIRDYIDFRREHIHVRAIVRYQVIKHIKRIMDFRRVYPHMLMLHRNMKSKWQERKLNSVCKNCPSGHGPHKLRETNLPAGLDVNRLLLGGSRADLRGQIEQYVSDGNLFRQDKLIQTLLELHRSDLLIPFNKTADWIEGGANFSFILLTLGMLYFSLLVAFLNYPIYFETSNTMEKQQEQQTEQKASFKMINFLVGCEVFTLACSTTIGIIMNAYSLQKGHYDETNFVSKLNESFELCKRVNMHKFTSIAIGKQTSQLLQSARKGTRQIGYDSVLDTQRQEQTTILVQRCRQSIDEMNTNLLWLFMHFKIYSYRFALEIRPPFKTFVVPAAVAVAVALLTRLNSPYLEKVNQSVNLSKGYMLVVLVPVDLTIMPFCHLHRISSNLLTQMSHILAHVTLVERIFDSYKRQLGNPADLPEFVYDPSLVSSIRKETSDPNASERLFILEALGAQCTYDHMLRIHFWIGLVALSLLFGQNFGQNELLARIFDYNAG